MTSVCVQVQELLITAPLLGNRRHFEYGQLPFRFVFISSVTLQRREIHDNTIQYLKISWNTEKTMSLSFLDNFTVVCQLLRLCNIRRIEECEVKVDSVTDLSPEMNCEVAAHVLEFSIRWRIVISSTSRPL
jgi:hypothetical protein